MKHRFRLFAATCAAVICWGVTQRSAAHDGAIPGDGGTDSGAGSSVVATVPCENGFAGIYPCSNIDLMAYLPLSAIGGGANGNDVWGWTDPGSGREFAIVGRSSGTAFVEVTNPSSPIYLGDLPTASSNSLWREMKTYSHYALIVSEAAFHGMQIFDLNQLLSVSNPPVTFTATANYNSFSNCHNIVVNEQTGYAYCVGTNTCSGGLHMIDIHNPLSPTFAGCYSADGYTHDAECVVYNGPDATYAGHEICFSCNEDTLTLVDVSNKSAPVMLSRTGYVGRGYTHQGWLTADQATFLLDDEFDESTQGVNTRTFIWNVTDLDAPVVSGLFYNTTLATDHNQYIRQFSNGEYTFQANYRSGLHILRIDDPSVPALHQVGFFDIYPADDNPGYNGAWGNYPFFPSGTVLISGIEQGLFVVRPNLNQPTPTPSASASQTRTRTSTPSITSTPTITATPTRTGTATQSSTPTLSPTITATPTATGSPTRTATFSPGPPGISGTLRYQGSGALIDSAQIDLSGPLPSSGQSDVQGHYAWMTLSDAAWQVQPHKVGGRNSAITAFDASAVLQAAVGTRTLSRLEFLAGDANGSGNLTAFDAVLILRLLVGMITELPAATTCGSDWFFEPNPAPTPNQTLQEPGWQGASCFGGAIQLNGLPEHVWGQDFTGILMGDAFPSWAPATGCGGASVCVGHGESLNLRTGPLRRARRGGLELPLYATDQSLQAAQAVMRFDPAALRFKGIRRLAPIRRALLVTHAEEPGSIRLALASPAAVSMKPDQAVAVALFEPVGTARRAHVRLEPLTLR